MIKKLHFELPQICMCNTEVIYILTVFSSPELKAHELF